MDLLLINKYKSKILKFFYMKVKMVYVNCHGFRKTFYFKKS